MTYKVKHKMSAVLCSVAMAASIALAGCGHPSQSNYSLTPSPVTPAAEITAEPEATVSPEATISPQPTTSPEESEAPEATATPEASETPEESVSPAEPESTPEASAVPETKDDVDEEYADNTVAAVAAQATDNSGDDCGWVEDWSMADGGYCSLHPEWYGMAPVAPAESYSAPAAQAQPSSGITFYNQLDKRWSGQWVGSSQFGPHGCCPTAVAMMLSGRGIYMTPLEVGWLFNSWGIFGTNGYHGTSTDAWPMTADYFGWNHWDLYSSDDLYNALASGADVGLALNYGNSGHTVYVRGVDAYGNTTVYDGNSGGPYTKSIYTLWNQVYDPYEYYGVAVAIGR